MKKTTKKQGRPKGAKNKPNPDKKYKHISYFSGLNIPSKQYKKEKVAYEMLKHKDLLKFVKIHNPQDQAYEDNEDLKSIALIKGMDVKDLIKGVIENYIKEIKTMLKNEKEEVD